jgi:hypothetical protein
VAKRLQIPLLTRRWLLRLSAFAGALLVALVLAEGVLFVLGLGAEKCYEVPRTGIVPHEPLHYRLPPDYDGEQICPRSGWSFPRRTVPLATNGDGFRDPERSVDVAPDTTRIVILGDSVAMGHGVRREDAFPARLEVELASALPHRRFEVINTGIWGMSTEMETNVYEAYARDFRPDVVLVVHVMNDAELTPDEELTLGSGRSPAPAESAPATSVSDAPGPPGAVPDTDIAGAEGESWSEWLASRTVHRAARWTRFGKVGLEIWRRRVLGRQMSNMTTHKGMAIRDYGFFYQDGTVGWDSLVTGLSRLSEATRNDGAWAGVVLFPMLIDLGGDYPYADVHGKIAAAAASTELPVLDLVPAFSGHDGHELWITSRDDHPNEEAHAIAARAISAWLLREVLPTAGSVTRNSGRGEPVAGDGC